MNYAQLRVNISEIQGNRSIYRNVKPSVLEAYTTRLYPQMSVNKQSLKWNLITKVSRRKPSWPLSVRPAMMTCHEYHTTQTISGNRLEYRRIPRAHAPGKSKVGGNIVSVDTTKSIRTKNYFKYLIFLLINWQNFNKIPFMRWIFCLYLERIKRY